MRKTHLKSLDRLKIYDSSILSIILRFLVDLLLLCSEGSSTCHYFWATCQPSYIFWRCAMWQNGARCIYTRFCNHISTSSTRNLHDRLRPRKLLCTLRWSFPLVNRRAKFFAVMSNEAIDILIVRKTRTVNSCCKVPNCWWRAKNIPSAPQFAGLPMSRLRRSRIINMITFVLNA